MRITISQEGANPIIIDTGATRSNEMHGASIFKTREVYSLADLKADKRYPKVVENLKRTIYKNGRTPVTEAEFNKQLEKEINENDKIVDKKKAIEACKKLILFMYDSENKVSFITSAPQNLKPSSVAFFAACGIPIVAGAALSGAITAMTAFAKGLGPGFLLLKSIFNIAKMEIGIKALSLGLKVKDTNAGTKNRLVYAAFYDPDDKEICQSAAVFSITTNE